MPRIGKEIKIGSYLLELYQNETEAGFEAVPCYNGEDMGVKFFHHLLPRAQKESLDFLKELGIDAEKITLARPLTEPDERGEILYLCCVPLCARVLAGGDTQPRQSEEVAGVSVIFVGDKADFSSSLLPLFNPMTEMRFVIPLPFDASFFSAL